MEFETVVRERRTHKAYGSEPVAREVLDELFELARWAPNHHLTNPWRFRVIGPGALERLKEAAGPEAAVKLDRAPTLVAVTSVVSGDPVADEEDLLATAAPPTSCCSARTTAGWPATGARRPCCAPTRVRRPWGSAPTSTSIGLLHLGQPRQVQRVPARAPATDFVTFLS